jgi:hypothetical protein
MGLAWLFRRRRAKPAAVPALDPAEELKQKLAESRPEEEQPAPASAPEPPPADLEDRRREVHERGRASIEQMRGQPPPD